MQSLASGTIYIYVACDCGTGEGTSMMTGDSTHSSSNKSMAVV